MGPAGARAIVVESGCLYWADGHAIRRARLDGPGRATPEVVASEESTLGESLATDGRFLYWPDGVGGRIMRAGRGVQVREANPPPPEMVAKRFAFGPNASATAAVVDADPPPNVSWAESCRIRQACREAPPTLPTCPPGTPGEPWTALAPKASAFAGQTVRVRGTLSVGPLDARSIADDRELGAPPCRPGECCQSNFRLVILGGAEETLHLLGLACAGDDSRLCCNALALGQTVIATGRLVIKEGHWFLYPAHPTPSSTGLVPPDLCVPP